MYRVRRAARSDSLGLISVARDWPTERGSMIVPLDEGGAIDIVAEARHLDDERYCILVAAGISDDIVAYAAGLIDSTGQIASLEELVVAEAHQGRGIGTLLVRAFERWAGEHACRTVSIAGGPAPGFYAKVGYTRTQAFHFSRRL